MSNMRSLNRSSLIMILVLSLMMLGTCVICWHFKVHQTIGKPAFRIVPGELMNEKSEVVRTNIIDLPVEVGAFTSKPMIVSNHELDWLPDDTLYGRRRYTCTTNGFFGDLSIVLMEKTAPASTSRSTVCRQAVLSSPRRRRWNFLSSWKMEPF